MFLTRSEYDRSVRLGEMVSGLWVARTGARSRPGFCRVMGRPRIPSLARPGDLLPSLAPAVILQARRSPGPTAASLLGPDSVTRAEARSSVLCLGKKIEGAGTPTFNPEKSRGHPLPCSSFREAL